MKLLRKIRNYLCYCGIEKDEYNAIKKNAYISNFEVWRLLHIVMDLMFGALFVYSLVSQLARSNMVFYLATFCYSALATVMFFVLKKESIIAQFLIYLSIIMLLLFGCFVTSNKPSIPGTTFMVFLIITPLFMIDKPYYMIIVLLGATAVYITWMYYVKDYDIWRLDMADAIVFMVLGMVIHVISNSIRIKEFVLFREINIQKDIDDMTGLMNKGSLSRHINEYLADKTKNKGLLFFLDINYFKSINDTFGHDIGDDVIHQLGSFLATKFTNGELVGRFGGDEFIIFIKDNDDVKYAEKVALEVANESTEYLKLPDPNRKITVSMGIAIYHGEEKNYSELLKKADVALYATKEHRENKYSINK